MNIDIQKLIIARIESGLNLEEIAEKTNISRATLYRIEKGLCRPRGKTLKKLSEVYNKPFGYFLKGGQT